MMPGNRMRDNWYMGLQPKPVRTLKDLLDALSGGFNDNFKLQTENGEPVYVRMSSKKGVIIIDGYNKEINRT